jgi:hypothetical protein
MIYVFRRSLQDTNTSQNVMAATYPELFAAATAYSGVPAGCFVSSSGQVDAWNSTCAQGNVDQSAAYWTNVVKGMYPGYSGARPRFQVYHGSIDTTLRPNNYRESVKEWTGVFGYDATKPQTVKNNFPANGYTTDIWGVDSTNPLGKVQGIYALNVGHTVPINGYVYFIISILQLLTWSQCPRHGLVRSLSDCGLRKLFSGESARDIGTMSLSRMCLSGAESIVALEANYIQFSSSLFEANIL